MRNSTWQRSFHLPQKVLLHPAVAAAAADIVQRLLTRDPSVRPTAEELLCHPWLAKHGVAPEKPLDSLVITRMRRFAAMNKLKKVQW